MHDTLFPRLDPAIRTQLDAVMGLIDKTFPLPRRFERGLPRDVAELSRLFTNTRGERTQGYLGTPKLFSAYLRCFLPWNLYRVCRLLPGLTLDFSPGNEICDLGSGPLTLVLALWIARPELRTVPLSFRCIDRTPSILRAGKQLFDALCGPACPWRIILDKTAFNTRSVPRVGPRATFTAALNVFNEVYPDLPHASSSRLAALAGESMRILESFTREDGLILVLEHGNPVGGTFIASLRQAALERKRPPLAPCTHAGVCPFPGMKAKWCHFAFDTEDSPEALRRLSSAAGLSKERAALSFLHIGPQGAGSPRVYETPRVRVISDAFPLSNQQYGRYACSERALVLLSGDRAAVQKL